MPKPSPNIANETERLLKWREVRRRASDDPVNDRHERAAQDREQRLALFEEDKTRRIREAEDRRRADIEGQENRRMEKARAHLEALDDIETAKARLLTARQKARHISLLMIAICVGLPTLLTAIFYMFIADPVYKSTSILALESTQPIALRNPLFTDSDPFKVSSMAPAFQLRAQLYATISGDFDIAIDTHEGLLTLTSFASTSLAATALNTQIIKAAPLGVLVPPNTPQTALPQAPKNTLLVFLTSLSLFAIAAVFIQTLLHHARS